MNNNGAEKVGETRPIVTHLEPRLIPSQFEPKTHSSPIGAHDLLPLNHLDPRAKHGNTDYVNSSLR